MLNRAKIAASVDVWRSGRRVLDWSDALPASVRADMEVRTEHKVTPAKCQEIIAELRLSSAYMLTDEVGAAHNDVPTIMQTFGDRLFNALYGRVLYELAEIEHRARNGSREQVVRAVNALRGELNK